ncbi:PEGA domain-containing protein [Fibrobacterota bacterium]
MLPLIISLWSLGLLAGCATIMHGRTQEVRFTSEPEGARIIIDEKEVGTTPEKIKLKRDKSYAVRLEKDNYEPHNTIIKRKISKWFWGNALCLGGWPICFFVDFFNGAINELEQDSVCVDLALKGEGAGPGGTYVKKTASARNVAIMDLKAMGIGDHVSSLLSEKLRSELFSSGAFTVMNREDMAKLMDERSFQRSEDCDTPECFAEIGRMLGVEKIISGSIGKLGSTYSLTIKQIDIETSKNDRIINLSEKCDEDDLFKMIEKVSRDLIRGAR